MVKGNDSRGNFICSFCTIFKSVGFGKRMKNIFCMKGIAITALLKHFRAFVGTLFRLVDYKGTN